MQSASLHYHPQVPHPTSTITLHSLIHHKSSNNPNISFSMLQPGGRNLKSSYNGGSGPNTTILPSYVDSITSNSNPFIKHCVKIRQSSSYRHSHGSTLVVGTTPIREIYNFHLLKQMSPITMDCLFLLDGIEVPEELDDIPARIVRVSSMVMRKLSGVQSTESIEAIALMTIPPSFINLNGNKLEAGCKMWFPCFHRILVLEGIQDPGNLGTLLRSAMAFRWDGVFLLPGCCDPFNEKSLRASRGAAFQLPVVSGCWNHLNALRNELQVKMLAGHPASSSKFNLVSRLSRDLADFLVDTDLCLVLGSEGGGLSESSRQACELVSIPMAEQFESLNVAVAGGIFLFMLQPA